MRHYAVYTFENGKHDGHIESRERGEPYRPTCFVGYTGHATFAEAVADLAKFRHGRCDGHCALFVARRRPAAQGGA